MDLLLVIVAGVGVVWLEGCEKIKEFFCNILIGNNIK
jgi:hypothetical protein